MRTADTGTVTNDLADLDDPALIKHWASVRGALALTPKDNPGHTEIKRAYDEAMAEYRRRLAAP